MRKYFDTVINSSTGRPIAGATVALTSGGNPVQLYTGNGTGPITDPINQVVTDSNGLFQFYVADGGYTMTISLRGVVISISDVEIYDEVVQAALIASLQSSVDAVISDQVAVNTEIDALRADYVTTIGAASPTPIVSNVPQGVVAMQSLSGQVIALQRPDGSFAFGPQPRYDWYIEARGSSGSRQIWAWSQPTGEFQVSSTYDAADNFMPKLENLRLSWRAGSTLKSVVMGGSLASAAGAGFDSNTTKLIATPVLGQSTSNGNVNNAVVTTTAPRPSRVLMAKGGIRILGNEQLDVRRKERVRDTTLYDFVPALEQRNGSSGETGWACAGYRLTTSGMLASNEGVAVGTAGIGSVPYNDSDGVRKGSVPYSNLIRFVQRLRVVAGLNGRAFEAPWVFHPWHEGSVALSQAAVLAELVQAQGDYNTDIGAITGSATQVLMVTDALASFGHYVQPPNLPYAVLQAATTYPTKIIYACPRYFLQHMGDDVHMTAAGCALRGEYFGRAAQRARAGADALPVYMTAANRTGAVIVVDFHVQSGNTPIQLNTSVCTNPGAYGFEFVQTGGNSPTISNVAVTGAAQLTVTLSVTPTGTSQKLRVASQVLTGTGPTAGPRSCITDSAAEVSLYGATMVNYAAPQEIAVA